MHIQIMINNKHIYMRVYEQIVVFCVYFIDIVYSTWVATKFFIYKSIAILYDEYTHCN